MQREHKDGFERRKEKSREIILHAAMELFSQFGVERVSIADIARKAGVAQATIYNHYGGKEALIREFVSTMINQLVEGAQQALSPDLPFEERISSFVAFITGALTRGHGPAEGQPLLSSSPDLQSDPEIQRIRSIAQEKMIELLLSVVHDGSAQGHIQKTVSDEAYTLYFHAFMEMFTEPAYHSQLFKEARLAKELTSLMITGLF